jgi:hypothetical protein
MTHHIPPKECEALQRAHGLGRGVDVTEHNVRLSAHLHSLERDNIQNDAIGCKQHVQVALEIFLRQLVVEIVDV